MLIQLFSALYIIGNMLQITWKDGIPKMTVLTQERYNGVASFT